MPKTLSNSYTYYHRGSTQDVQRKTQGGLALMGGSTDVDEVFRWMADRGGNGDFLVLRGSGSDGYQEYIDQIADVNSVSTLVIRDSKAAEDKFVLDKVKKAEAIFFAGGDQWNYVGKWKNTELLKELNKALIRGVPMGGTSAGLAILGEHVFTAEKASLTSSEALEAPLQDAITLESDFLKAPTLENVITDTHFSERDRMGRLVTFMARLQKENELKTVRGIGVDEKTAVLVSPDGGSRTVGEGGAHFVEAEAPAEVLRGDAPLTHRRLTVQTTHNGENFDLSRWIGDGIEKRAMTVVDGELSISPW